MHEQRNLNLVKKFFEEVHNKGDLKQIEQLCCQDFKLRDPTSTHGKIGLDDYKERQSKYQAAFPDKSTKIDHILAAQDWVVVRWTASGTHKGSYQDRPATHKIFKINGISCLRVSNGKITEIDQVWDRLGLLEQLGFINQTNTFAHPLKEVKHNGQSSI